MKTKNVTLAFDHDALNLSQAIIINGKTMKDLMDVMKKEEFDTHVNSITEKLEVKGGTNIRSLIQEMIDDKTIETDDELARKAVYTGIALEGIYMFDKMAIERVVMPCTIEKLSISKAIDKFETETFDALCTHEREFTKDELHLRSVLITLIVLAIVQILMGNKKKLEMMLMLHMLSGGIGSMSR
jgi:hypothetical protein